MIDHIVIGVKNYETSREFYRDVLAPLGYELLMEIEGFAGFGPKDFKPGFWMTDQRERSPQVHFCFQSPTRAGVRNFHKAALAAGGKEETPPGIVEEYHPSYYAAFVFDPDGYKIEAVCLEAE